MLCVDYGRRMLFKKPQVRQVSNKNNWLINLTNTEIPQEVTESGLFGFKFQFFSTNNQTKCNYSY